MKKIYEVSFMRNPNLDPLFFENQDEAVAFVLAINLFLASKGFTPESFKITTHSITQKSCSLETFEAIFSNCLKHKPSNN